MAQNPHDVAADILDKTAEYVAALEERNDLLEQERQSEKAAHVEVEAKKLARQIHQATGTEVDLSVAKKIAASDDKDVKELINKLASVEEVEPLGSVRRRDGSEKVAGSTDDSVDEADATFAQWILS